jgi:hypothetical protein
MAMLVMNPNTGDFQSINTEADPCCIHAVWETFARVGYQPWCYLAKRYEKALDKTTTLEAANTP